MSKTLKLWLIVIAAALLLGGVVAFAQTQSNFTVGGFTIVAPASPAITVNSPARNGTLALKEDIPPPPPGSTVFAGQITVNGSATFTGITAPPVCSVSPRFATSANGLQVTVIDYVCAAKNN